MTGRDAFTSAEWRTLAKTPPVAMVAVMLSSSGGFLRELRSLRRTLEDGSQTTSETELLRALTGFVAVNADQLVREADSGDLNEHVARARALDAARESMSILHETATVEECDEYRQYVLHCARTVALAGVEGGFLGFGGRRLSQREERFLDALAEALGESLDST